MVTEILLRILEIYSFILVGRVILSFVQIFRPGWSPPGFLVPVVDIIYGLTEPPLQALRRVIPQPMGFPFDLSFIVLFLIVYILQVIVASAGAG